MPPEVGVERGSTDGHKEALQGEGYVHYPGCGNDFTRVHTSKHKSVHYKHTQFLYSNEAIFKRQVNTKLHRKKSGI